MSKGQKFKLKRGKQSSINVIGNTQSDLDKSGNQDESGYNEVELEFEENNSALDNSFNENEKS